MDDHDNALFDCECDSDLIVCSRHPPRRWNSLVRFFIQHGGPFDWSKVYYSASRQREFPGRLHQSAHPIISTLLLPRLQLWRAFTWVDRWLSWGSAAPNRGALTCQLSVSPSKTSSVMSSPPCQSQWHIKFVSGNSVGDYSLIQCCPEPLAYRAIIMKQRW